MVYCNDEMNVPCGRAAVISRAKPAQGSDDA